MLASYQHVMAQHLPSPQHDSAEVHNVFGSTKYSGGSVLSCCLHLAWQPHALPLAQEFWDVERITLELLSCKLKLAVIRLVVRVCLGVIAGDCVMLCS